MRGILFDLPHVVAAMEHLRATGVGERCEAVGGDMFAGVPDSGDADLSPRVVHDWDDARTIAILRSCRRAMGRDGRLLLVEEVITPGNGPSSYGKLSDLNMLVSPGRQERTEDEYRALYEAADFALARVVPTRPRVSVIEGTPI